MFDFVHVLTCQKQKCKEGWDKDEDKRLKAHPQGHGNKKGQIKRRKCPVGPDGMFVQMLQCTSVLEWFFVINFCTQNQWVLWTFRGHVIIMKY